MRCQYKLLQILSHILFAIWTSLGLKFFLSNDMVFGAFLFSFLSFMAALSFDYYRYWTGKNTFYAITNLGAHIFTRKIKGHEHYILKFEEIGFIREVAYKDNTGYILFQFINKPPMVSYDFLKGKRRHFPTFENVSNRSEVKALLTKLIDQVEKVAYIPIPRSAFDPKRFKKTWNFRKFVIALSILCTPIFMDLHVLRSIDKPEIIEYAVRYTITGGMGRHFGEYVTNTDRKISNSKYPFRNYSGEIVFIEKTPIFGIIKSIWIDNIKYYDYRSSGSITVLLNVLLIYTVILSICVLFTLNSRIYNTDNYTISNIWIFSITIGVLLFLSFILF